MAWEIQRLGLPPATTSGFVLTKVRNATWRSQYDVGVMALFLFLHLPFCRAVYAVFFGGSMPRVSRSFSSEKSYSPSMLM
jgi:hypothetical protein